MKVKGDEGRKKRDWSREENDLDRISSFEGKRTLSTKRVKTRKENEKTRETTTTTIVHFVLLSFQAWN